MCCIVAKYFKGIGWVAAKNRDRNYVPDLSFPRKKSGDIEMLLMLDDVTKFTEGLNSNGVCVLTASLMVEDDEKEITVRSKTPSKDGSKIANALKLPTVREAVQYLVKTKLPGNTLVFDKDNCYLIEGTWKPGGYAEREYVYKVKKINNDETVCRTNHGILLPWAGYQQKEDDIPQSLSAISSRCRYKIGKWAVNTATTPEEMIDLMCKQVVDNPQLNALRMDYKGKEMRTTAQLMLSPGQKTLFLRPVASNINFDFWKMNKPDSSTWLEILSNRALYMSTRDLVKDKNDPDFPSALIHSTE